MTENYALSKIDFEKGKILSDLQVSAYNVNDVLPDRTPAPRAQPLALASEVNRSHVIEVKAKGRELWLPEAIEMKAGNVTFSRQVARSGDLVKIAYRLNSGSQNIAPAKDAEAIYAISDAIKAQSGLRFYLDKSPKPSGTVTAMDMEDLAPYRGELQKAAELMAKGDQASAVEALSILNQLAEKIEHPSPAAGLIDGLKGMLLAHINRPVPAKAALLASIDQFQGNADMIRTLAALQVMGNELAPVLKTLNIALEFQPSVVATLNLNLVQYLFQQTHNLPAAEREKGNDELCVILATGKWRLAPRVTEGNDMLGCAIRAHLKQKRLRKPAPC